MIIEKHVILGMGMRVRWQQKNILYMGINIMQEYICGRRVTWIFKVHVEWQKFMNLFKDKLYFKQKGMKDEENITYNVGHY
jgi:hypothetical protein